MIRVMIESMPKDYSGITLSVVSLLIAVISLFIALKTLLIQKRHNIKSIRPIIDILVGDYEDDIYVKLRNNGMGPAVIDELLCEYSGSMPMLKMKTTSLIEILKNPGTSSSTVEVFTTFVEDVKGRTLPPNGEIVLVQLKNGNLSDNVALRLVLKDVDIQVKYRDIYDQTFQGERKLSFFGR